MSIPVRSKYTIDDEREALWVASPVAWGWDECVVCGSKDVTDRGMVVMASKADGACAARIAWCDGSQECRDDLRQAGASMLTEDQAEAVDAALRRTEVPEPQGEPSAEAVEAFLLEEWKHEDWGYDWNDSLPYCVCGDRLEVDGDGPVVALGHHRVRAALRAAAAREEGR